MFLYVYETSTNLNIFEKTLRNYMFFVHPLLETGCDFFYFTLLWLILMFVKYRSGYYTGTGAILQLAPVSAKQ